MREVQAMNINAGDYIHHNRHAFVVHVKGHRTGPGFNFVKLRAYHTADCHDILKMHHRQGGDFVPRDALLELDVDGRTVFEVVTA